MTLTAPRADPWAVAADLLDPPVSPYINAPGKWTNERLGEHVTYDQRAVCESVVDNRYTAVPSCHDVGKSYIASRIAAWFIEEHPPGEAFVVTTAPTNPQVKAILWREIGRAHRKGDLRGRITLDAQWKLSFGSGPDELVAYGRKPADYEPSAFSGIHARYVLVIIDEAGGVPKSIFEAADTLVTNVECRVLAIGNPDDPASYFAEVCKPGSGWNVIHLDALRSPNFTADEVAKYPALEAYMKQHKIKPSREPVPDSLRPLLVSPLWVDERLRRWGAHSPLFTSKVRGKFPVVSQDSLIEPGWVTKAQVRELVPDPLDSCVGVDVARYGMDKTIIVLREGGVARAVYEGAKTATTTTSGQVELVVDAHPARPTIQVDDVGVGGGVTDQLREDGYAVVAMIGGAACTEVLPNGKAKFVNARAEWYWTLREAFAGPSGTGDDGWIDIDLEDEELAAQLVGIKYGVNRHGQIWVETKEEMAKRGVSSPDRADALVYAWVQGGAANIPTGSHRGSTVTGDLLTEEW